MQERRLGTYVSAENVPGAFKTAADRYKARYPRLHVETIAVQEMADDYVTGIWRAPAGPHSSRRLTAPASLGDTRLETFERCDVR
jgi:hypothetical protein